MLLIWNRRELLTTYDVNELAAARNALSAAGIDYDISTHGPFANARTGANPEAGEVRPEARYILYAHKDHYDEAVDVLQGLAK